MAPAAQLTGKWATAEDTARALGVSQKRLKELKELAAIALGRTEKKSTSRKSGVRQGADGNRSIVARTSKAAKTHNTKSARTTTKKVGAAKRAKS